MSSEKDQRLQQYRFFHSEENLNPSKQKKEEQCTTDRVCGGKLSTHTPISQYSGLSEEGSESTSWVLLRVSGQEPKGNGRYTRP